MTDATPRKTPLWLIISLLVNLILIGFLVGSFMRDDGRRHHNRGDGRADISLEDRRVIRSMMRDIAQEARTGDDNRRAAAEALAATLIADPYSEEDAKVAFTAFRDAEDAARRRADLLLANRIASLSPEQRRMVVEIVARERRHRGGRGDKDDRRDRRDR